MNLKLDNKLLKYLTIIIVVYFLISKMPQENIPGNNPFILTAIIIFILFILDQPNILFEGYAETEQIKPTLLASNESIKTKPTINKEELKIALVEVLTENNQILNVLKPKNISKSEKESLPIIQSSNLNPSNTIQEHSENNIIQEKKSLVQPSNPKVYNTDQENNSLQDKKLIIQPSNPKPLNTVQDKKLIAQPSNLNKQSNNIQKSNQEHDPEHDLSNLSEEESYLSGMKSRNKIISDTIINTGTENCNCEDIADKAITKFLKNRRIIDNKGMLHYADSFFGDMGYSQIRLDNYIPLGSSGDGVYDNWDLSQYSVINTDRWKPTGKSVGKCRTDILPDPQPVNSKTPMNLMNWDYSEKVLGPDNININYITDKLNKTTGPVQTKVNTKYFDQ